MYPFVSCTLYTEIVERYLYNKTMLCLIRIQSPTTTDLEPVNEKKS